MYHIVLMEKRRKDLSELHGFIEGVDKEVNMILQNLKWDRKRIKEDVPKATCSYDRSHKVAPDKMEFHERQCFLKCHSYDKDLLLPDPLDVDANTLITLDKQTITMIINNATCGNPLFKQGIRRQSPQPWTLERLQATYTMDERCALHDAVVQAVPSCHNLADLALPSNEDDAQTPKVMSRAEILAELRNMKRRRVKYRVAAKTRKYSDVLRDVIKTQMELYMDATHQTTAKTDLNKSMHHQREDNTNNFPLHKSQTSRDKQGIRQQDDSSSCNFQRRNGNTEKNMSFERRERSTSGDKRGTQLKEGYWAAFNSKNKERIMPKKVATSSVKERDRHNRNDYSSFHYDQRRTEKNEKSKDPPEEKRERQLRNYSSSFIRYENKYREPKLRDEERENRMRHEVTNTYRHKEKDDYHSRKRRENETSHDYSYVARSRKRNRENSASLERDRSPSTKKYKTTRHKHSHRTSRDKNTGRDGKIRVKLERDEARDRVKSESEKIRYDHVYTSRYRNRNARPRLEREGREKHYHKYDHSRHRDKETDISIKIERETPGREYTEIDTRSNYTRTSTCSSSGYNDYSSSSGSDNTTRRDGRTSDAYKDSHKRSRYEHTKVRVKKERGETPGKEYHHYKSTHNRKKHSHRNRSEESDSYTRRRERERHANRYTSNYEKEKIKETRIEIKKEKETPPESSEYSRKERFDYQYAPRNLRQGRRESNSSWE